MSTDRFEGLLSISIPAISSGIFGFPKERCAVVMLDAIQAFAAEQPDSSVSPRSSFPGTRLRLRYAVAEPP